jgi:hypothetical protein
VAPGTSLPHNWGEQYRSAHFLGSISWLGIADDAAFLGEPETKRCAKRWIRTLEEQCLWAQLRWLTGQLSHRTQRTPTKPPTLLRRHDGGVPLMVEKQAGAGS